MVGFAQGIKTLFTGSSGGATAQQQQALAQQQQSQAAIQQLQSASATQAAGDSANSALAATGRVARGQRLLISSNKDGGLASTLGGSS